MKWRVVLAAVCLAGCVRYAEFRLPAAGGAARDVRWVWEPSSDPVLGLGPAGAFDSIDALNPSIAKTADGYMNLYSGWDGKVWRTGLAASKDGFSWEKKGMVLQPGSFGWEGGYIAANGAIHENNYYYQAGNPPQIGLARGFKDKLPEPVLRSGPRGSWDELGVGDPYVLKVGDKLYMYYLGQDRARRQRLGVAESDDGVSWRKNLKNPILELGATGAFDENGLGEPAVWPQFGKWWMLYTGRDKKEWRRTGLAVSDDGIHWTRVGDKALLDVGEGWNSRVVCDPEVEVRKDGTVRVWFGGGNRPEPAENLQGQIGVGVLRPEPVSN
jgi:predicted GH43/DUF377 family glycosyl hydrolase